MRNFIGTIYEIAFSYEVTITLLYWSVLFSKFDDELSAYNDLAVHALPLAALLVDFIFNPISFEIKRFLIVLIAGTVYMLMNMAYSLGVEPVYGILDWVTGISYGLLIGAYVLLLIGFGFGILFYKCLKEKKLR